jgi:hypothetical protein
VVALFLETYDPLHTRIYRHRISIFWGVLKDNKNKNNPHTSEELKQNIEFCISNVTVETLHRVASNKVKRKSE